MSGFLRALPFLLGGFLGLAGVVAWGLRKATKARRRFWSHGKGQLLRPPGHTLANKRSEHWEKLYWPGAALFLGGGLVGALAWAVVYALWTIATSEAIRGQIAAQGYSVIISADNFWPTMVSLVLGLIGGIAAVVWGRFRFLDWLREDYRLRTSLRGEQAVAEELQPAVRAGYHLFNDIPTEGGGNVDHALVGPAGVFAIETKARPKPENADGKEMKAEFDGVRITFTGGAFDTKAPKQAEAVARWLADSLSRSTGKAVHVKPVIALPGWFVPRNTFPGVIARNPEYFAKELRDAPRVIGDSEIEAIVYQLEQMCRDVAI